MNEENSAFLRMMSRNIDSKDTLVSNVCLGAVVLYGIITSFYDLLVCNYKLFF